MHSCDNDHARPFMENIPSDGSTIRTSSSSNASSSSKNSEQEMKNVFTTPAKDKCSKHNPSTVTVTPINNIPYAHGGYAGAAPLLIRDEKWMLILLHLMPEEHFTILNYIQQVENRPDPLKVMKWAENNPVVAAYGIMHSKTPDPQQVRIEHPVVVSGKDLVVEFAKTKRSALSQILTTTQGNQKVKRKKYKYTPLEWDVFLDPVIVKQVDMAIQKMQDLMKVCDRDISEEEVVAANVDIDRQVSRLLNRMMLAHGSTTQLLVEAVGVASRYNFSRVVKTSKQLRKNMGNSSRGSASRFRNSLQLSRLNNVFKESSGRLLPTAKSSTGTAKIDVKTSSIFVSQWMQIFAAALKLGTASKSDIEFLIERQKIKKNKLKKTRSLQHRTSQFLRGALPTATLEDESIGECSLGDDEYDDEYLPFCGLFSCLGVQDSSHSHVDHDDFTIAQSAEMITKILGEKLRLVLDMKSRHVPARVWGRLIDNLRSRGVIVEGIGSFDIDELRQIENSTSTPITTIFFFHSAGDLQRACHANEIKRNDTVYFNAGSLTWKSQNICEASHCWSASKYQGLNQIYADSESDMNFEHSSFQPYAYPRDIFGDDDEINECKATLADYQKHFDLNIGLYVQEFSIGAEQLDKLARLVNKYPNLYRCGLAWGGLNGVTIKEVKGDGYWSQRYVGRNWTFSAAPERYMTLIAPEDHHAVHKAIMYGACGQVTTVNDLLEDEENLICQNTNLVGYTQTGQLDNLLH